MYLQLQIWRHFGYQISGVYPIPPCLHVYSTFEVVLVVNFTHRNWLILELYEAVDRWREFWCEPCSENVPFVAGNHHSQRFRWNLKIQSYWSLSMIFLCLVVEVESTIAIWVQDVFSPASKKVWPKICRKYSFFRFKPKKSRPDSLHTHHPSHGDRSSTCQQNVPWSQKVSP